MPGASAANWLAGFCQLAGSHSQRRRVGQVAQAGLLWEQHRGLAIGLDEDGLGQVDLAKLDLQLNQEIAALLADEPASMKVGLDR